MWSFVISYHSSNDIQKRSLLNNIENIKLNDAIDPTSTRNSIRGLAFEFSDEKMLLVYLLNEASEDYRNKHFDHFYSLNSNKYELKEINKKIVNNEKIDLSDEIFSNNPSLYFYLAEYTQTLNVVDSSIFDYIIEFKNEKYSEHELIPIENELYLAALFYAYYNLNEFQSIDKFYSDLIDFKLFPDSYSKRNLFWSLDYVMYQTGNIDKSLEVQRNFTIPLTEYLQDQSGLNEIYSSHGGYLYMLGKYQEARRVFQHALQWSDNLSNVNLTRLYNNLSLVYFKTGESGKYVETQLRALEHAKTYDNYDHQIKIYNNLHIFYRKNQNPSLAISYINRAAELAESISNTDDLISIYISKAVFEKDSNKNFEQALALLNKAESLIRENTSNRTVIRILSEKADILNAQGNIDKSIELQNRIVDIGRAQSDPSIFLEATIEVAELELKRKNFGDAKRLLTQFKSHDISIVDFSVLTLAQIIEAKLAHEDDDFARAEQRYNQTAELVLERARYSADYETGYWTVESEYLQLFESYADFLIERNKFEEAVQLLDRVKTINDASMLQNPLITSKQLSEEELAKDRQLTRKMEILRSRAFTATGDEKFELNTQIERLQAQKRELHQQDRSLTDVNTERPIWSVQRSLSSSQILLHVTNINNNYYISEISPSTATVKKLELTNERKDLFEGAIQSMITGRTDLELLFEVSKMIGITSLPSPVTSIIMMADGYLHQLPIDVLPLVQPESPFSYGSAEYLVEKIDIRHLNHLGEIFEKNDGEREYERDFSGFGVADFQNESTGRSLITLPRAPDEIRSVSKNLSRFSQKEEYTGLNATPQSFRRAAGNSKILHMATHSEISESDPLFSRIHLVPDSESGDQTNQIFAYELFDLNLNNELIMLNSCESGGDRAIQGSGIMGISRALHYAGAKSLILNAWSVNDQFAAEFANIFYTHINAGETKSRALQLTKIDFIKNSNANPHFWGPYILNGSNEPLIQKRGANLGNWLVALVFIAGFLLVSRTRQRVA
ncbi:CHAT domain-containing protein [Rhodohalobacter sp. 8-1]|uniref:CHAT domain-containing protein n=1 Tax=Rhodohalobacter sp. 8-1 TaxID=3131972 RepID=UPI0030EDCB3F